MKSLYFVIFQTLTSACLKSYTAALTSFTGVSTLWVRTSVNVIKDCTLRMENV